MTRKSFILVFLVCCIPMLLVAQNDPDELGYIRRWVPQKPIDNAADVITISENNPDAVHQMTTYYDGFGRVVQKVSKQASPLDKDVVSIHLYDDFGQETKKYLPFVSNTDDGNYKDNALSTLNGFNQTLYPDEGNYFYSKTVYEKSPLNRVLSSYAPGTNWVGSSRGGSSAYLVNTAVDNVQIWNIAHPSGSLPVSSGAYPAGKLYKTVTTNIKGKQTIIYKNAEKQVILKKVQLTASVDNGDGSTHAGWLCTYYVYDDYNNLRFVVPPKAVNYLRSHSWTMTQTIADELCFRNEYDNKNRKMLQKAPGAEEVQMAYDLRDRLVFSQDGNQRNNDQWTITYYDGLNRPVETGIYTDASATRASLQQAMDALGDDNGNGGSGGCPQIPVPDDLVISSRTGNQPAEYIARNSITFMPGFEAPAGDEFTATIDPNAMMDDPNCSGGGNSGGSTENPLPPVPSSKVSPLTYTYYDNYDWSGHQVFKSTYLSKATAAGNPYAESPLTYSKKTLGQVTGTKVKVLGSSPEKWLITTTYYDDKGRILQTLTDNRTGGTDVITNKYDFSGKLLSSYVVNQNNNSTLTPEVRVLTENKYDEGGRLLTITKIINDEASTKRVIATNTYDELSQLKTITLGDDLETLHYDYNIRGWLTGINKDYTKQGNNDHYFGMELGYDKSTTANGTTTFTPRYDGNISGTIWKGKGDEIARKYDFRYDNADRLTTAEFNQNSSGSSWDHRTVDFSVNNIAYDINGNISKLSQHGLKGNNSPLIDDLEYDYQTNSNKLLKVTDGANDPATTLGDFHDGSNSGNDYSYDANGNLTQDLNKSISSITYNDLNLPEVITFTGDGSAGSPSGTVEFTYDAVGNKLQKTVTDQTASPAKTVVTNYVDGFVYQHTGSAAKDTLQFFPTEEGRVRYVAAYDNNPAYYTYDYFITDHLGNTRVVLTEQTDFSQYLATLETDKAPKEEALFYNLNSTRVPKPVDYPQDHTTSPNQSVAKLNGKNPDKRIGPSIILKVMAGDTIQAAVRAYYKQEADPKKNVSVPAEQILTGLLQALVVPGAQAVSTHGSQVMSNARTTGSGLTASNLRQLKSKDPENKMLNKPKAYLNYVFFDKQLNFVDEGSGVKQVDGDAGKLGTLSSGKVVTKKDGYVYIFTSNESQQDVFFDNLGVMDITGPILEETHYYPDGLTMAGISTVAPLKIANRFKYQDKELQSKEFADGSGLEWYDFEARYYDPQLGRWWSQDPAGQFASPYLAMGNNWVIVTDPDGEFAWFIPMIIGAVMNTAFHANDIHNVWQGLGYAAVGGAAGVLGAGMGAGISSAMAGGSFGAGFLGTTGATATGFFAGAASGAGTGLVSGFSSTLGNSLIQGNSFGSSIQTGFRGGVTGALSGGFLGGISGGINAISKNTNFFTGKATVNLSNGFGAYNVNPSQLSQNISIKYVGDFENINVYESSSLGYGSGSGGITLPGFGITVGKGAYTQMGANGTWNLLAHEFGHVLQSKIPFVGADGFYGVIAPESLASATFNSYTEHGNFWTETWANYLSHNYFSNRGWNFTSYPIRNISNGNLLKFFLWRIFHPTPIPAIYP